MKRVLLAMMIAVAGTAPAHAQIAAAIGKPLESPDLPPGTLSVRVVAGSPQKPVIGTEVTLLVGGQPQSARTDSAGRAHFKGLPQGVDLQAKVLDEDKKEVTSETFQLGGNGARLMLTTLPWNPGSGGGGPMMGGGEPPNPRQMSGEPRPESKDAPGTFTVRLTYDDFKDAPPVDVPVALVGYAADYSVTFETKTSDKDGRATFDKLDRSGATAYFAMAQLPRGNSVDRLIAVPTTMDPRVGVRLILSSEKRSSTAPPVDDLTRLEKQDQPTPAGKVRITLEGGVDPSQPVTLWDAETHLQIGRGTPAQSAPDPQDVLAEPRFGEKADLPAGALDVIVHGGANSADGPLTDISVKLTAPDAASAAGIEGQTSDDGKLRLTVPDPKGSYIATISINGKTITSEPFSLEKTGGVLEVEAHWDGQGKPEVVFDLVPRPGQVVYAETNMHGQVFRTVPFQPVADRGTRATLFIFPRILFSFSLHSQIDDEYLGVGGTFTLSNNSWIPYSASADGLIVPLPRGFTGGIVGEQDQGDVSVEPKQGFRLIRPIAPGSRAFRGGFSLPVENGEVHWALDLPFGSYNSGMEIVKVPGMSVDLGASNMQGREMTVPADHEGRPGGTFYVLPQISILPKQSMVMTIKGLPAPASWRIWLPRIIGVLVVIVVIGGISVAIFKKRPDEVESAERTARRQKLLDELVELEKSGKTEGKAAKRREQIMTELEALWDDDGRSASAG